MTSLFPPLVVHFLHSLVDPRQLHGYSGVDSVEKNSQYRISFKIIQHVLNPVYIFIKCIAGGIKQGKCRFDGALGLL